MGDPRRSHRKASDVARSLALAALALVWVFRESNGALPKELRWPAACVIVALACDLLQYVVTGFRWSRFVRRQEARDKGLEDDIGAAPAEINDPPTFLYYAKIVCVIAGYSVLLWYAVGKLFS
jgi:hypothetical protein